MTSLALLALLALPAVALALPTTPGDGTLSVRNGDGFIRLELGRGAAIGRIADGTLTVVDPKNGDCEAPLVWEDGERAVAEEKQVVVRSEPAVTQTLCVFKGLDMRFRLIGADAEAFRLRGTSIGLSVVGRGIVYLKGKGEGPDGTYSLNGDDYASLPDDGKTLRLAAPDPAV